MCWMLMNYLFVANFVEMYYLDAFYLLCVYAHLRNPKFAYTEGRMRINGSSYMCILPFVYVHLWNPKCAYTKGSMRINGSKLPYMRIYGGQNAHIRKLAYAHIQKLCIYGSALPYMRILPYGDSNVFTFLVSGRNPVNLFS